ncbi:MAG: hypothetical protein ACLTQI_00035 [Slackia sp.]
MTSKSRSSRRRSLPKSPTKWVKETLGFADVAELRVRMGESIEQQKGEAIPRIMENNALYAFRSAW